MRRARVEALDRKRPRRCEAEERLGLTGVSERSYCLCVEGVEGTDGFGEVTRKALWGPAEK